MKTENWNGYPIRFVEKDVCDALELMVLKLD